MADAINGVGADPYQVAYDAANGADQAAAAVAAEEMAPLLGDGTNVYVNKSTTKRIKTDVPTDAPELEPSTVSSDGGNIEKLICYLQILNDKIQTDQAEERLTSQNESLEAQSENKTASIDEQLKSLDEMMEKQKAMKIFSWVMIGISLVAAAVTGGMAIAASVAVVGAEAAAAASVEVATQAVVKAAQLAAKKAVKTAVKTAVSAGLGLTFQTLNETGVTEEVVNALAESLESNGCSKEDAMIAASVIVGLSQLLAVIGGGAGAGALYGQCAKMASLSGELSAVVNSTANAGKAVAKTTEQLAKDLNALKQAGVEYLMGSSKVYKALSKTSANVCIQVAMLAAQGVGVGVQTYGSYVQSENLNAQADTTELEAVLNRLRQMIEETTEELQQLLAQTQNLMSQMAGIISSSMEVELETARNMGQMA